MGSNDSKPTKRKKNDNQSTPVLYTIQNSDPEYRSDSQLSKELPDQIHRHHKLKNPSTERPMELSWLQQNNSNDNYNRIDPHQHHHHHHHHHHEHLHRLPLAINRWPKDNDHTKNQKPQSFIEEYIHHH